jgi:NAD(P)-dependent dehydrogenase (short-subunit alcohol dehydrogenase family)
MNLTGKVALVTGAGGGIGAAVARNLHDAGCRLVLVDLSAAPIEQLAAALGTGAIGVVGSVTERSDMDRAVGAAVEAFGGIDIVFANAGIAAEPPTTIRRIDEAIFERVIEVDTLGVWRTVRACLPQIAARQGHVLITASIYAHLNGVANAPYAMSKAAVESFGRSLRAELAGTGATAGVLYPGWVETPIARSAMGGNAVAHRLVTMAFPKPLRTPIQPVEVAVAVRRGIERRSARIMVPRRWVPLAVLRGVVGPLSDLMLDRNKAMQAGLRELEGEGP